MKTKRKDSLPVFKIYYTATVIKTSKDHVLCSAKWERPSVSSFFHHGWRKPPPHPICWPAGWWCWLWLGRSLCWILPVHVHWPMLSYCSQRPSGLRCIWTWNSLPGSCLCCWFQVTFAQGNVDQRPKHVTCISHLRKQRQWSDSLPSPRHWSRLTHHWPANQGFQKDHRSVSCASSIPYCSALCCCFEE
jgi:hypothetical protein